MQKRIKSIIFVVMMLFMCFDSTMEQVFAISDSNVEEVYKANLDEFTKSKDKYKYTNGKIEEEMDNSTGIVDEDKEIYLNENGIFDNELDDIDELAIAEINEADIDEIRVYTTFFEYEEENIQDNICENESQIIDEKNMKELTSKEINEVIGEIYYDKDVVEQKKEESILDMAAEKIGLKPVEAYASVNSAESHSAYLKKSILILPNKINGITYYRLYYVCQWIKLPLNRNADLVYMVWDDGIHYDRADRAINTLSYVTMRTGYLLYQYDQLTGNNPSEQYDEITTNLTLGSYNIESDPGNNKELKVGQYSLSNHSIIALIDLVDDSTVVKNNRVYKTEVDYIIISMSVYLKKTPGYSGFTVRMSYDHTKSDWSLDIKSVQFSTISTGDLAVSFLKFVLYNTNCIKYSSCSSPAGKKLEFTYTYK